MSVVTILIFLLILSVLVLIHEAGHFFVAKKLGVKVEEFGFGFPPRLFGERFGETLYSINLLPIGGFVKLYGEDEAGAGRIEIRDKSTRIGDKHRAFFARSVWQRATIVVAGVVMNFLLSLMIVTYLFAVVGIQIPGNHVIIDGVLPHTPAAATGLQAHDTIISVNGQTIADPQTLISVTKQHVGQMMQLKVDRGGKILTFSLIPRRQAPAREGAMGIRIGQEIIFKKYPWYQAPFVGLNELFQETWGILTGLGMLVTQVTVSHTIPQGLAGPVGVAQLTGQVVQFGPNAVLSFMSLLSLNLAILNVLPIPALDGGRLFFIIIEGITGRKVNEKFEAYTHTIGMALLLTLIAYITYYDIIRLIHHQSLLPQ